MIGGLSLEEAITLGRGIERPFLCPAHADSRPSASVNVVKNVWVCYTCAAKGRVDGNRVPTDSELEAMLRPEQATRIYPESWLELFTAVSPYWETRFPSWLCRQMGFGEDPVTGDPTFPVHTPEGRLAGVGRRPVTGDAKYRYPPHWSASRTLGGNQSRWRRTDILMIVEGYPDAAAGWETGTASYCCWGAGVHLPQTELITRMAPKLILLGFDADDAGYDAADRAAHDLTPLADIHAVDWAHAGVKDPAELEVNARATLIAEAVAAAGYGHVGDISLDMAHRADALRTANQERTE